MSVSTYLYSMQYACNDLIATLRAIESFSDFVNLITSTAMKILTSIATFFGSISFETRTLDLKTIAIIACVSVVVLFLVALLRTKNKPVEIDPLSPPPLVRTPSFPCLVQ